MMWKTHCQMENYKKGHDRDLHGHASEHLSLQADMADAATHTKIAALLIAIEEERMQLE
jgi:hypothetical protein